MTAKERILKYLEFKNISQYAFSKKTGLANGFLNSGSSLSVDNLKLISNTFPDLNIIWVVTERGDMLSSEHIGHSQNGTSNNINNSPININQNKDAEIEQLKRDVDYLTELLKAKDEIIKLLKTKN